MAIELLEAKELLGVLERMEQNPELILSGFIKDFSMNHQNFLCQVHINGVPTWKCIIVYLYKIPVFSKDISLKIDRGVLSIFIPSLLYPKEEYSPIHRPIDKIMEVDFANKTFFICQECVLHYEEIKNMFPKQEFYELADLWRRYENLTISKRWRTMFVHLKTGASFSTRISNAFFVLTVKKEKMDNLIEKEKLKVKEKNEDSKRRYLYELEKQKFYSEHISSQISAIQQKQKEIMEYLFSIGYQMVTN